MTHLEADEMEELAVRFFDALEQADVEALRALYAEGATLWTCTSQRGIEASQVAGFLPILAKKMPDRRYAGRRVVVFEGGFVQRHRLCGTRGDGAKVAAECCAIVFVENGRVTRVEEYFDSRQLQAVMG